MFKENPDFFPTPSNLIHKMLSKLDFRSIRSVLEPSGGKGDLIEAITAKFKYHQSRHYNDKNYDIDTIELDISLQMILKGKNYRLIHDDFLTFSTYKRYDAIIANFPFSQGDRHTLKAIEIQEQAGGDIVCLINSETIKNPYSNSRKELVRKLEEYNAEVEYIQDAFMDNDSQRKTAVEVALIHISIPKIIHNSSILESLKQNEATETNNEYYSDKLINSDFITGIVDQYNYEVKAGLRLINEYNSLVPYMLRGFSDNSSPILKLELEYKDDSSTLENAYIKQIRQKYWSALFSNDQFMGLFTSNLKSKYMQHVEELKDYDFSFYNIYTLRIQISKEMVQGVEDTILNLFEEFSHKHHYYDESSRNIHMYSGWKTNQAYKINKKIIIPLNAYNDFWGKYEPTSYKIKEKLADIEKVFSYLDSNITEPLDMNQALKMAEHYQETKKIELKFFYATFYKKGTLHLEFKNMDLLSKFNLFGSQRKNFLPPSYGKSKYKDMTVEEKAVVDEFEGEQSYNKVMQNKSYFIVDSNELLKLTS
jgi:hypothetical protein